jgi:hypothetical protein
LEISLIFDHAEANMSKLAHGATESGHFTFAPLE